MLRVYLLYCLSGFISLGYQVAWFRLYTDQFGSTNLTFVLVLCNFIGGLGVGALFSRSFTRQIAGMFRLEDRLRLYGTVELLVTATIFFTVVAKLIPADLWGTFPYQLRDGIFVPFIGFKLSHVAIATVCVFVPCFFMGVTFPLLCHAFRDNDRFPSSLYGWNTLGACSGVLVCQFLFLPVLGHDLMFLLLALANGILGTFFVLTGEVGVLSGAPEAVQTSATADRLKSSRGPAVLITCCVLSGLLGGAMEGDMFKRVGIITGPFPAAMSFISFWAVLGIFLASFTVRIASSLRLAHIKVAFILALMVNAAVWHFAYPIRIWLEGRVYQEALDQITDGRMEMVTQLGLLTVLMMVGAFLFPAYFLISLLLPYICNRLQSSRRHLGIAYGMNTLAFCLGMVGFTWIAPRVNMFYSMKLAMVLFGIVVLLLLVISEKRRLEPWKPALATVAFGIGCVVTPSEFDRSYVNPMDWAAEHPVRALKSNGAHTTYVVTQGDVDILFFDDHRMSSNSLQSMTYMRLMAHFPLLAQSSPERALLIGFGVGNTAAGIAEHETIRRIDIVELNDKVIETAPEFSKTNEKVYLDPRVRFINDDGRSYLKITDQTYDLITSEPPPPMHEGVYRLYSREYYEQVLEHLTQNGFMTQWLPIGQMPREAVELVVSTFVEVFPHTMLFTGWGTEYILVGGPSPVRLQNIQRRFTESQRVFSDLRQLSVKNPTALLGRVIKGDAALRREYAGKGVISDQYNDLAHLVLDARDPAIITYDPSDVLGDIRSPQLRDQVGSVIGHLGRLRFHVDHFPAELLMASPPKGIEGLPMVHVNWYKINQSYRDCGRLVSQRRYEEASDRLEEVLAMGSELPRALIWISQLYRETGRNDKAASALEKFLRLESNEALAHFGLGLARTSLGEMSGAIESFQKALDLNPEFLPQIYRIAWNLAASPAPQERAPDKAMQLAQYLAERSRGQDARALHILAAAYASMGRTQRAVRTAEQAQGLAVTAKDKTLLIEIRGRLQFYRRSLSYLEPRRSRSR